MFIVENLENVEKHERRKCAHSFHSEITDRLPTYKPHGI